MAIFGRSKREAERLQIGGFSIFGLCRRFIKYSNIFEGNTADSATLPQIIDNLPNQTSEQKRALVIIDAEIATEDNLALIKAKGYDYLCVSRSNKLLQNRLQWRVMAKDNQFVTLHRVEKEKQTDYILNVKNTGKQAKDRL